MEEAEGDGAASVRGLVSHTILDLPIPPPPAIDSDIYPSSHLRSSIISKNNRQLAETLKRHGYAVIALDTLNEIEYDCMMHWESVFSNIFQLPEEEKENISKFDAIQGQTMGYRREGLREFIETRLQGNNHVLPIIDDDNFVKYVKIIWRILRDIVVDVISCMAQYIGIDPAYFLELIDQDPIPDEEVSSTVLRICSYPFDIHYQEDSQISFGAHTDTSFITVGTFSSTSGLEIHDLHTKSWISVEEMMTSRSTTLPQVSIFVGDVMHLLTRGFYTACVHRVRTYHRHPLKNIMTPRVSCPFIVRGRHKSKIRSIAQFQRYPFAEDLSMHDPQVESSHAPSVPETFIELPDFEDLNMKLIHTLLDRKRQKCMKENEEKDGDGKSEEWVLKAFY